MNSVSHTVPILVSAGVFDSSLLYSGDTVRTKNRRVSLFEIELPIGNDGVSHIGSEHYRVSEDYVLCAKPGQVRYSELPYKCYFLHLLVEDPTYAALFSELPDTVPTASRSSYLECFNRLIAAQTHPCRENEIFIQSKLLEILYLLLRENALSCAGKCAGAGNTRIIRQALAFIDTNFSENITLDDIAGHVHLSSVYFHNMFKAAVGMTPHRYLLERRLSHARKLLAASESSFSRIAGACGFPSQSYFNYVFKRELGMTPRKYRTNVALSWERE